MSKVGSVSRLPEEDRRWIERQLLERNFSDYDGLVALLSEKGLEISRSALGRYGKGFKSHCEHIRRVTDMAQMLTAEIGDEGNTIGDAALRSMQAQLLDALPDYDWSKIHEMDPNELSLSISRLSRAGVNQKKWMAEVKTKVKEAADNIEKIAEGAGASDESIALFRKEILGILE